MDAASANARVQWLSCHGSLGEMEEACGRLKRSGFCMERATIRAAAGAYMRQGKLYAAGEFARGAGLRRRDVGNELWNLLLLSYAGRFKMKSLQREWDGMMAAGFLPDLTTFNLRAAAFSRMSMLWDLHLTLDHMAALSVSPDLVTVGCLVDAYVDRKLAPNLQWALRRGFSDHQLLSFPVVATNPLLFEVLGKGPFHTSGEAFMEFSRRRDWTYALLLRIYTNKLFRTNNVFWNH